MSMLEGYTKGKFDNLVRTYRESIGHVQELSTTVRTLHDRVEKLENENAELRKIIREARTAFKELKASK